MVNFVGSMLTNSSVAICRTSSVTWICSSLAGQPIPQGEVREQGIAAFDSFQVIIRVLVLGVALAEFLTALSVLTVSKANHRSLCFRISESVDVVSGFPYNRFTLISDTGKNRSHLYLCI